MPSKIDQPCPPEIRSGNAAFCWCAQCSPPFRQQPGRDVAGRQTRQNLTTLLKGDTKSAAPFQNVLHVHHELVTDDQKKSRLRSYGAPYAGLMEMKQQEALPLRQEEDVILQQQIAKLRSESRRGGRANAPNKLSPGTAQCTHNSCTAHTSQGFYSRRGAADISYNSCTTHTRQEFI